MAPNEDGETAEEEDHADRDETVPRRVRLKGGFEREEVPVETLSVPAGPEPEVSLRRRARMLAMYSKLESSERGYVRRRSRTMSSNLR